VKLRAVIASSLVSLAVLATAGLQGCSTNAAEKTDRLCTPGAYVFCRCADRAEGTKLCKEDGKSFEACTTGGGECAGGEIDDPNTGEPIDFDGGTTPVTQTSEAENCPGQPVALQPGVATVIDGDTSTAVDDLKGKTGACAVGGGGADHVYRLQPKGSGSLSVKVQGLAPLDVTIYMRTTCTDEASQISCQESTPAAGMEQFTRSVSTGVEYFLVVDGASGTKGKYQLTAKLTTTSFCGDGAIATNEACDDGNKVEGDGCSNDCRKVDGNPTTADSCPGQAVHVWPAQKVTGTGTTDPPGGYVNKFTKTGTSCGVSTSNLNAAPDHLYAVTAHGAGNLKVTLTPDPAFNAMLVARRTCADPNTQAPDTSTCGNLASAGGVETLTFPVTDGETVSVAAEGALNAKGPYTIQFELL
jgi:cysteine-rich repeat protein